MSKAPKTSEAASSQTPDGEASSTTNGEADVGNVSTLTTQPNLNVPHVQEAIAQGLALIKDGKSKADAARAMYSLLKDEDKDLIVAAFVVGATLTEKGALTYWYNCKRRANREARTAAKAT